MSDKAKLLLACFGIAVGLVAVVVGLAGSETGDKALGLPDAIESTDPIRGAVAVPGQNPVFVDLASGYTGVLVVDGVEFPTFDPNRPASTVATSGGQREIPSAVIFEGGNFTLTLTPGERGPIERFSQGIHEVKVIYWPIVEGRGSARSYSFTFDVF
jgi:hypothetical protein